MGRATSIQSILLKPTSKKNLFMVSIKKFKYLKYSNNPRFVHIEKIRNRFFFFSFLIYIIALQYKNQE